MTKLTSEMESTHQRVLENDFVDSVERVALQWILVLRLLCVMCS